MTRSPDGPAPTGYRLRVAGHLDPHWAAWFGGLELTHHDDGTTSLTAAVCDQAALHGLLAKIRDLGVALVSVAVIDLPADGAPQPVATRPAARPLREPTR